MKLFVITIDTEADYGPGWVGATPESYRNLLELERVLLPITERWGAPVTLLLSGDVIERDAPSRLCEELSRKQGWELGAHLHGEFEEPQRRHLSPAGVRLKDMQCLYSQEMEHGKMAGIHGRFTRRFGYPPRSFRAGRYGVSERTLQICSQLGYCVDSSVVPGVRFEEDGAVLDFRGHSVHPSLVDDPAGAIVEIPITVKPPVVRNRHGGSGGTNGGQELRAIGRNGLARRLGAGARHWAARLAPKWVKALRKPVWLRPTYSSSAEMAAVLRWLVRDRSERPIVANMMFHSNELLPGGSPYYTTEQQVRDFVERTTAVLDEAPRLGFEFCTLTTAAQWVRARLAA